MSVAPVVLIIFNRPDFAESAIANLSKIRPELLFLVADGPRNEEERAKCEASRRAAEAVDWPCEIVKIYSEFNLGCFSRVVSGLNSVFDRVDRAIILEDDMLADPSLFSFATELLDRYRDDEQVFTIGGFSAELFASDSSVSYSFSRYPLTWGWATWRRAWRHYDGRLRKWPELRRSGWMQRVLRDRNAIDFYTRIFDAAYSASQPGRFATPWGPEIVDAWDFLWTYTIWANDGLCLVPSIGMVENLGFRSDSTNVKDPDNHLARIGAGETCFPLQHPTARAVDPGRDAKLFYSWQRWRKLTAWQQVRFWLTTSALGRAVKQVIRNRRRTSEVS